jgi:hypothetical protein
MGPNDWSSCSLSATDVHVIRHVIDPTVDAGSGAVVTTFQEARGDGTQWTYPSASPPTVASPSNSGVALVSGTDPSRGMLLAAIGTDGSIHLSKWTAAGGWTQLPSVSGTAPRKAIAGSGCGSQTPFLYWTEGSSTYSIMGLDVSSLL